MQSAHAQLLQPNLWPSFTLPPRLARITKPINIERAYARSLKPVVSFLWRQRILQLVPPRTLPMPPPHTPSPSYAYDATAPPSPPTNSFPRPRVGTSLTNSASAPTAPPTLGDELHVILHPPRPPLHPRHFGLLSPPRRLCHHPRRAYTTSTGLPPPRLGPSAPPRPPPYFLFL